jgi:hypothetical protein
MLVSLVRPSPRLDPENICLVFGWINDREKRDKRKIITYQGIRKKREDEMSLVPYFFQYTSQFKHSIFIFKGVLCLFWKIHFVVGGFLMKITFPCFFFFFSI